MCSPALSALTLIVKCRQLEADFGYGDYGGYGYDDDLRFGGEDVGLDMETQDDEHAPVPVPVLNAQGVDDVGSREGDDRTERQPEEEEEQQRVDEGREDNEPFKVRNEESTLHVPSKLYRPTTILSPPSHS